MDGKGSFQEKLKQFSQREKARRMVISLLWGGIAFLLSVFISILLEMLFHFTSVERAFLFSLPILIFFSVGGYFIFKLVFPFSFSDEWAAKQIGLLSQDVKDSFLNALQIDKRYGEENTFVKSELQRINTIVEKRADLFKLANLKKEKRLLGVFLVILLVSVVMISATPLSAGWIRIFSFYKDFTPPPPYQIVSVSKDVKVLRGEDAYLSFSLLPNSPGVQLPSRLELVLADNDGYTLPRITMYADSGGTFSYRLANQKENTMYFASSLEGSKSYVESERHKILVNYPPEISSFKVSIFPPAYAKQVTLNLDENFGDASVLRGSSIRVRVSSTKNLSKATLVLFDSLKIPMKVKSNKAYGSFRVMRDVSYRFSLEDKEGLKKNTNVSYQITCVYDDYPTVRIVEPRNLEKAVSESMVENLHLRIQDDYGFSSLTLYYRLIESFYARIDTAFIPITLPLESKNKGDIEQVRSIYYLWDLGKAGMVEGDVIEFFCEVTDNDEISGYKKGLTGKKTLRVLTLEEMYQDVVQRESNTISKLDEKLEQIDELQKSIDRIQNDLRQKSEMDWRDTKAIEQVLEKQENMQKELESMAQDVEEMVEKMNERDLLQPQTLEKYLEVQELLAKTKIPEFESQRKQIQDALKRVSERDLREALKKMKFNEEKFSQMLSRIKELILRTQITRTLEEMMKRFNAMAEHQEKITKKTPEQIQESKSQRDELAREQAMLLEKEKKISEGIARTKELIKNLPAQAKVPEDELNSFERKREEQNIQRNLEQAVESIRQGDVETVKKNQKAASRKMRDLASMLSDMKDVFKKMQRDEMIESLRLSIHSSIDLSKIQESLKEEVAEASRRGRPTKERSQAYAVEQKSIQEALDQLRKNLQQVEKRSAVFPPQVSESLSKAESEIANSIDQLDRLSLFGASYSMGQAMTYLNNFAQMANEVLEFMLKNRSEGDGDGLSDIVGKQKNLNKQTESTLNDRLKGSQADKLLQLAAMQRMIMQQLQKLRQRSHTSGNHNMSALLEKINEEMDEAAHMLEFPDTPREVVKRQKRILSRLLNASRSLKERDEDKKREAHRPGSYERVALPKDRQFQALSKIQEVLENLKSYGYSQSYEKLIRVYLKKVEKKTNLHTR